MWPEFAGLMILAGCGIYATKPLRTGLTEPGETDEAAATVDDRKFRIYEALNDLEYDRQMQKISLADYKALQKKLKREALGILAAAKRDLPREDADGSNAEPAGRVQRRKTGQMADCPSCGRGVPANFHYCGQCGALLSAALGEEIQ